MAQVRARHSVFVSEAGTGTGRRTCYMFLGWLVGSLEYVRHFAGIGGEHGGNAQKPDNQA